MIDGSHLPSWIIFSLIGTYVVLQFWLQFKWMRYRASRRAAEMAKVADLLHLQPAVRPKGLELDRTRLGLTGQVSHCYVGRYAAFEIAIFDVRTGVRYPVHRTVITVRSPLGAFDVTQFDKRLTVEREFDWVVLYLDRTFLWTRRALEMSAKDIEEYLSVLKTTAYRNVD